MLAVVFGPRTRLAAALLQSDSMQRYDLALVARHDADAEWISASYPRAEIIHAGTSEPHRQSGQGKIAVFGCAFGMIHPDSSQPLEWTATVDRDLRALEQICRAHADSEIRMVYVSSALALSPRRGREAYAGWKSVMSAAVASILGHHPQSRLSILYPGRLVDRKTITQPLSFLYTTYCQLADTLIRTVDSRELVRRIIGLDARLWLASRGVSLLRLGATARV